MPKPFKLQSTRTLPAAADIVQHEGRPHVRLREKNRTVLFPLTKDGRKYLRPSKCWYFECKDANGTIRRKKGFADLKATEQLAAEVERKVSRVRSGLTDPAEEHALRPLAAHLIDFAAHLEAKGDTAGHVAHTVGRLTSLFAGCRFVFPADADAGRTAVFLTGLRRGNEPVAVPPGDAFTPAAVARLLGISGASVSAAVRRMNLPATGNGQARRYPRATVEALTVNRAKGCGPETVNHYVRAVRGFFRWMLRAKRYQSNPLESLALVNANADVRRGRRELTADELRRLFAAARASRRTFRGLTGEDRYTLYLVASGTGFRANALANLTPPDFDPDAGIVTLPARFNKSRKLKVQPIPPDVAAAVRVYMSGKPANAPAWGGSWVGRAADMLRIDLDAAGIPYTVEGPDGPRFADFHSLRHSYLTMLGRNGVDLRTAQELAGHSTPTLTARYTHRRLDDLAGAVGKLPMLAGEPAPPTRVVRVVPGVVSGGISGHSLAPSGTPTGVGVESGEVTEGLKNQPAGAPKHRPASARTSGASGIRTQNQGIMSPLL